MNNVDTQYLNLLRLLLDAPVRKDRTGVGVKGIFHHSMRFDLQKGFPLLTTKRVPFKSVLAELLWFISGDTNIKYLLENNVHIWTDWRLKEYNSFRMRQNKPTVTQLDFEQSILISPTFAAMWGSIGLGYGHHWRKFGESDPCGINTQEGFDQLAWVINEIKTKPTSRRLIVSSHNPHEVGDVDLPPCHNYFQFQVSDGKLNCYFQMRSTDVFLGLTFNIASYALLTHMVAQVCGLQVGELVYSGVDVHLYLNHIEQAKTQLKREPYALPQIKLNPSIDDIFKFTMNDVELIGYQHHDTIKAEVAV